MREIYIKKYVQGYRKLRKTDMYLHKLIYLESKNSDLLIRSSTNAMQASEDFRWAELSTPIISLIYESIITV